MTQHIHAADIKVRKGTGKTDIDGAKVYESFPARTHWICTHLGKRSNGEPKPEGQEEFTKETALEAFAQVIDLLGAHVVVDAYNHGHDLRTRAQRRPKSATGTKTARRQEAVLFIMSNVENVDLFTAYQDALRSMDQKLISEFLDVVYEENVEADGPD